MCHELFSHLLWRHSLALVCFAVQFYHRIICGQCDRTLHFPLLAWLLWRQQLICSRMPKELPSEYLCTRYYSSLHAKLRNRIFRRSSHWKMLQQFSQLLNWILRRRYKQHLCASSQLPQRYQSLLCR